MARPKNEDAAGAARIGAVRMKKTHSGSPNGWDVVRYHGGSTYRVPEEMPESLAKVFIDTDVAEPARAAPVEDEPKAQGGAPENKSLSGAPETA